MSEEVVLTDPRTGGRKGYKLARFDLIPAVPLWDVAEHYGKGAQKYDDRNWEKGYPWSLSFGAAMRHLWLWRAGEDDDPETGSSHLAAGVFHLLALMEFADTFPEGDDRALDTDEPTVNEEPDDAQFDFEDDAVRWIEVGDLIPPIIEVWNATR